MHVDEQNYYPNMSLEYIIKNIMYIVAVNKKLTLRFRLYDRGTVVRRAVKWLLYVTK